MTVVLYHRTSIAEARTIMKEGFVDVDWDFGLRDARTGEDAVVTGVWLADRPLGTEEGIEGDAVLANTSHDIDDIGLHLLNANYELTKFERHQEIEVAKETLERYVGRYQLAPSFIITVTLDGQTKVKIEGPDKQKVGQVASEIRAFSPAEPYKGKGVKYKGERIRRKEGKTVQ